MGANYDLLISPNLDDVSAVRAVSEFLLRRGLSVTTTCSLGSADVNDDNAVLFGPATNGWVQMVASPSAIAIELASWFDNNPLASHISAHAEHCIHLWSLDSGYVTGYAVYIRETKAECRSVFADRGEHTMLIENVPVPPDIEGSLLSNLLKVQYDFPSAVARQGNLEVGLGELVARFGFESHLVEFHEALDDLHGIAIRDGKHCFVQLSGWSVLVFGETA